MDDSKVLNHQKKKKNSSQLETYIPGAPSMPCRQVFQRKPSLPRNCQFSGSSLRNLRTFISFQTLVIVLLRELEVLPSKAECCRGEEVGSSCYSIGICRLSVAAKERIRSSFQRGCLQSNSHKVGGVMIQYHKILSLMVPN